MHSLTRRNLLTLGTTGFALAAMRPSKAIPLVELPSSALVARARDALAQHRDHFAHVDRIGIVDFSRPSRTPRFFIIDLSSGETSAHLVAHGRGSDPEHTGWLRRFSNEPGSFASSSGAYATGESYIGGHGRSLRLKGLGTANCNAEMRAIVIHAAWYVSSDMVRNTGKLGRSEGCFAVSATSLDIVLKQLGPGRLLFADKA